MTPYGEARWSREGSDPVLSTRGSGARGFEYPQWHGAGRFLLDGVYFTSRAFNQFA